MAEPAPKDGPATNPAIAGDRRPLIIGIAGGIGSGKSAAAACLERLGCVVSDSDRDARAALDRQDVRDELVSWWGGGVIDAHGNVDRKAVASIVFDDPEQRSRLESLVHPIVHEARLRLIERAARDGAPAVVIDAPLLFEAGIDAECDAVIFIDTPRQRRLERLRSRGWDEAELERRERSQWPLDRKRARSTHAVANTGAEADLCEALRRVLDGLLPPGGRHG